MDNFSFLKDLETALRLLNYGYDDLDAQERAMVNDCLWKVRHGLKALDLPQKEMSLVKGVFNYE